jgi:hypothetical protein
VTWNHPSADTVLYLTGKGGKAFALKPGKTWFQVINPDIPVKDEGKGAWRFKYNIKP